MVSKTHSYVIGVAGGSGAGKTTVVEAIAERVGRDNVVMLQHDSYYLDRRDLPPAEREDINFDHPSALESSLLVSHIESLLAGHSVGVPVYDFATHTRIDRVRVLHPKSTIIVDGILIFADRALRELMDLKVFVETDADLRFIRRLERDVDQRGRTLDSVVRQYLGTVKPMHDIFVEPTRKYADIIIPCHSRSPAAIEILAGHVERLFRDMPVL